MSKNYYNMRILNAQMQKYSHGKYHWRNYNQHDLLCFTIWWNKDSDPTTLFLVPKYQVRCWWFKSHIQDNISHNYPSCRNHTNRLYSWHTDRSDCHHDSKWLPPSPIFSPIFWAFCSHKNQNSDLIGQTVIHLGIQDP